jgi:Zn-dependent metalloprotease
VNRRHIVVVPILASLWAARALGALPSAGATPSPTVSLPVGNSAFSPDPLISDPSPGDRGRAVSNALRAINEHPREAHLTADQTFTVRSVITDDNGMAHVRFDRFYRGLPVYGGDIVVHLNPDGAYASFDLANPASVAVPTTPSVPADQALAMSRAQFQGTVTAVSTPRLAVRTVGPSAVLVWEITVSGVLPDQTASQLRVLVDAHTGQVVHTHDDVNILAAPGRPPAHEAQTAQTVRAAQTVQTTQTVRAARMARTAPGARTEGAGNSLYGGRVPLDLTLVGITWSMKDPAHGNGFTTNMNHATAGTGTIFSNASGVFGNGTTSDPASAAADAHYGAAETFSYYKYVHHRSGIFGNGAGVPSRTHYGNGYVNAFWDGTQMTYGDGRGNARPLAELDVTGHEMSHGVSGALVGWQENGETGGMNEGTSDIFGTMVEFYANNPVQRPNYTIGELLNFNGDHRPLRYMYNPSLDGVSPNCYTSGIGALDPHYSLAPLDHWFFLLAVGSGDHGYGTSPTCNGSAVTGIGNDRSGKIWYRALAVYANSNENYASARTDSLRAAADLYGSHCTEYNTVNAAWAAVNVTGSDPVSGICSGPSVRA